MKCKVFMALVHSTRGPRWPMELDTLDGKNTRSSCITHQAVSDYPTFWSQVAHRRCDEVQLDAALNSRNMYAAAASQHCPFTVLTSDERARV